MAYPYTPSQRLSIRDAGYDEPWLQRAIYENPSMLGLGDLRPVAREVKQRAGGRLDFLFFASESNTMFEVELLLGATDESHIIRTLEYWDIESRRWPDRKHKAVIVAEEITNRFFNVIWLLNRSLPIIAIKLDTLLVEGKIALNFTKILDIYETPEKREPVQSEASSRQDWEKYSNPKSLSVADKCLSLLSENGKAPRISYNQSYIALGGIKRNFIWFYPGKREHCMVDLLVGEQETEATLQRLQEDSIEAHRTGNGNIQVRLFATDLDKSHNSIYNALKLGVSEGGGL